MRLAASLPVPVTVNNGTGDRNAVKVVHLKVTRSQGHSVIRFLTNVQQGIGTCFIERLFLLKLDEISHVLISSNCDL